MLVHYSHVCVATNSALMLQPFNMYLKQHTLMHCLQAALALVALHAVDVLHRDIKPDNMLLCHDGSLLLNDYDVSCTSADLHARSMLQVGTPAFSSPRSDFVGQGQYQFQDDWLALGLSFAHLANLYPKPGDCKVKLDALQKLQQQVWCPASVRSKIQETTKP